MSSRAQISAVSLAPRVRLFILVLVVLGLLGAIGLAFTAYRVHQLNVAVSNYGPAASLYRVRTAAIHQLSDMETSFHRFLLDGNSASLTLMQRDKERIEQMAQEDPELKSDQLLQSMVAKEQKWSEQVAPLVEERKNLPPGQGISEDFVAHYRVLNPDLDVVRFESSAERDYRHTLEALNQSEQSTGLGFFVAWLTGAVVLAILMLVLAASALRQVTRAA
jgi:hypothetical protein